MAFLKQNFLASAVCLAVFAPALLTTATLDLERITPVPDTQKIPIMDFFRPRLLQQPTVNPSGTHIAAIVAASEDHTSLMVYDLKSAKMETIGSRGDSDIRIPTYLGNDRLMYLISIHKLGGFIIAGAKIGALQAAYPILQNINGSLVAIPRRTGSTPCSPLAAAA